MEIKKVNLNEKFNSFNDLWSPKIIGELNEQFVKVVKFKGEFILHKHEGEDEMFLVIDGQLKIELDKETLEVNSGEMVIIPKGVNHKPIAIGETKVMLFESKTVLNTGNTENSFTVKELDII